ncbi:MAG: nuclear transport factor 2 family protein [Betaproteobacteria bacterium]|nr:nuclear transport factor 2 family protein [Betaproteobacteria bacterium]
MNSMSVEDARAFALRWLPAWTGNQPELLASFYSDDTFYLDPAMPDGLQGKAPLLAYFRKLLAKNPDWVWSQIEAIPLENGFLNKWHVTMPVGTESFEFVGVCLVQFNDAGKIRRNEVYFDRSRLLASLPRRQDGGA